MWTATQFRSINQTQVLLVLSFWFVASQMPLDTHWQARRAREQPKGRERAWQDCRRFQMQPSGQSCEQPPSGTLSRKTDWRIWFAAWRLLMSMLWGKYITFHVRWGGDIKTVIQEGFNVTKQMVVVVVFKKMWCPLKSAWWFISSIWYLEIYCSSEAGGSVWEDDTVQMFPTRTAYRPMQPRRSHWTLHGLYCPISLGLWNCRQYPL